MRYASRIHQMTGKASAAWDVHLMAAEKRARGERIILLTVGDTDFASPEPAVTAVHDSLAAGRTHYGPSAGGRPLREAIARHHARKTGQTIEQIRWLSPSVRRTPCSVRPCVFWSRVTRFWCQNRCISLTLALLPLLAPRL